MNLLSRSDEARDKAAAQFKAKESEAAAWRERTKRHEAETEKMLRLRALRLDKEAADKVAAATAPKAATRAKRSRASGPKLQDDI